MSQKPRSVARRIPWYYQPLIKTVKPLYQFVIWRRHQQAKKQLQQPIALCPEQAQQNKQGEQTAQTKTAVATYQDECDVRFGRHFPARPHLPSTWSTPSDLKESSLDVFFNRCIWCHAVSLGETNTIAPMLQVLLQRGATLWLTNTTQTGFARAEQIFSSAIASGQLVHTFVPIDADKVIEKFVEHVQPNLVLFVETELWATTLAVLAQRNIATVLVNGRLSQPSFKRYQKFAALSGSMMQNISLIIAQDAKSAKRFRKLGAAAAKIRLADSLKWSIGQATPTIGEAAAPIDTHIDTAINTDTATNTNANAAATFASNQQALERPIWVAGSTHAGEEQWIVQAHQYLIRQWQAQQQQPNAPSPLLIMVPRHPERFAEVAQLLAASGLVLHRRSHNERITGATQVYLVDSMGELDLAYQLADVAFVGGSLVAVGGHNPIEASRLGKPVLMGHFTQSCQTVVDALREVGALQVVEPTPSPSLLVQPLQAIVLDWLLHPDAAQQAGKQGQQLVLQKQNAMAKQLAMIEALLKSWQASNRKVTQR